MTITRRRVLGHLLGAASVLTVGACTSKDTPPRRATLAKDAGRALRIPPTQLAGLPDGLNPVHFIIHNKGPLALESKRASVPYRVLTPADRLFVRNNLPRPSDSILEDRDAWVLEVKGSKKDGELTLGQLKILAPATTETMVLQCSGNGRAFFEHGASGSQWATGAAGCVSWTGIKVSDLFTHLGGTQKTARYLTGTGGEPLPKDVPRNNVVVERSIPIEKGLKDCVLAWQMNGEPIPISHGGPLRLVVPGYFGCNQIKYIKRLAATGKQSPAKIQQKGYRFRAIGESGSPDLPSMWRMPVKSWFISAKVGQPKDGHYSVTLKGVAFSGERGIDSVVYSMDNGTSWLPTTAPESPSQTATFGANAWRRFSVSTTLKAGRYRVVSKATDNKGDTQPKDRVENERSYGHNGWFDHGLEVMVGAQSSAVTRQTDTAADAQGAPPLSQAELDAGRTVFTETATPTCGTCHTLEDAKTLGKVGPNLDVLSPSAAQVKRAVQNGVGAMPGYQGRLTKHQLDALSKYVESVTKP